MSILNYTKNLRLFNSYELKIIQLLISQLNLEQKEDFFFLKEIDLNKVQFFWYKDDKDSVLGGYHFLSYDFILGKHAIYINDIFQTEQNSYLTQMNNIISVFPTIMHELCHYWQNIKNPLLYFILQLPIIRQFTIEKQAYKISEYLFDNNNIQYLNAVELVKLKCKYKISKLYFDEYEMKILKKEKINNV